MSQTINIKDIPGYKAEVDYGSDFGHEYILQDSYHFSWGSEIAFYNRKQEQLALSSSHVALWRIKERH